MQTRLSIHTVKDWRPISPQAESLLTACAHYRKSDLPMFAAGYNELSRVDLSGRHVLEICSGRGELAAALARAWPKAEVFALDRYPTAGEVVRRLREDDGFQNAHNLCGDALDLTELAPSSFDLVIGQAAFHHLAHDPSAIGRETSRVLKPGGRLVFINEPLGHNVMVAMVRAFQVSRHHLWDESNLFVNIIEDVAKQYRACEIQVFNLLGYPLKFAHRIAGTAVVRLVHRFDSALITRWPRLGPLCANANIIFTR